MDFANTLYTLFDHIFSGPPALRCIDGGKVFCGIFYQVSLIFVSLTGLCVFSTLLILYALDVNNQMVGYVDHYNLNKFYESPRSREAATEFLRIYLVWIER